MLYNVNDITNSGFTRWFDDHIEVRINNQIDKELRKDVIMNSMSRIPGNVV